MRPPPTFFVAADRSDAADTLRLASWAGPVDILVSNAGLYEFAPTAATDAASSDRHIAINTRAPFLLVGAPAPGMAERGRGSIVIVGSSAARQPAPVGAAYGASKAGAEILTRYWATEFGPAGVRVNTVSPGPVHTEGTRAMLGEHIAALDTTNARGHAGAPPPGICPGAGTRSPAWPARTTPPPPSTHRASPRSRVIWTRAAPVHLTGMTKRLYRVAPIQPPTCFRTSRDDRI
ncbi:short-chain dehydrogenase/reductase SDR [Actinobacteria bacterium OK074]|nr:short-chain dehydrogenase/reductase SDR [Actinobacteria bacterium OK074]